MGLFRKLFGKKESHSATTEANLENDPNYIRMYDEYGREMYLTKERWRLDVLPANLKSNWNKPDKLYHLIVQSLTDGFRADVIKAAEQLYKIDAQHDRGAAVWGIVLMEEGRLDEAEDVFQGFLSRHGENGVILTNLAKVFSRRNNEAKAEEILWRALEIDPNQENGLDWYCAIHSERGGEEAWIQALRKIASLPGSWRSHLWLARTALQAHRLDDALNLYRQSLARVAKPVPSDLLMQMSGDLGNAGYLSEILQLCEPCFVVETHGVQVGNNLIKANLDLGHIEAAKKILNQLYALKRSDWQQTLSFWDMKLAEASLSKNVDRTMARGVTLLVSEGPVWLAPETPGVELFPAKKSDGIRICFLGSTAEIGSNSQQLKHQLTSTPGRLSRAIPLFLTEYLHFNSDAHAQTFVPFMIDKESAGFVLSGVAWTDEGAVEFAQQYRVTSDLVAVTHLKCQEEPWTLELRLVRVSDRKCIANLSASFTSTNPEAAIPQLSHDLLKLLEKQSGIKSVTLAPLYQIPSGADFPYYLLRLEQMLAVRCSGREDVKQFGFLSREREIIDGNIQLCLACPQNVATRLLLAKTLLAMKRVRPDILSEFKDKLAKLQKAQPLLEPAQTVIQKILDEALAT